MAFGPSYRVKTALIDLNFVPLRVRGLQGIRHVRCRNTKIDSRIFLPAADPPFERQNEIAKLFFDIPIETVPAGGLKHEAMMNHGGRAARLAYHFPIRDCEG